MDNLLNNIQTANRRIKAVDGGVRETPLDESFEFSERTGTAFLLKGEHLHRTGSFKFRGTLNRVLSLNDEDRNNGVVAASSGNHGIADAEAARRSGVDATIYLPKSVSALKLSNMKRLGANTVVVPGDYAECEKVTQSAAARQGKMFLSPYSDPAS